MRSWAILLSLTLAAAARPAAQVPARNVVVITLDGLRWQEVFTGADRDYFKKGKDGEPGAAEKRFWRETPAERRATLMPFIWSTIAKQGQIFGDPTRAAVAHVTNGLKFSYPGYNEMLSGRRRPAHRQQRQGAQSQRHRARVAQRRARASRAASPRSARGTCSPSSSTPSRSGLPVGSGLRAGAGAERPTASAVINELAADLPPYWDYGTFDAPIVYAALEYAEDVASRACSTSCSAKATSGRTPGATISTSTRRSRADRFIRRLWETLQSMPEYADKTTLLVTTDHGRGATTADWNDHGTQGAGRGEHVDGRPRPRRGAARRARGDDGDDIAAGRDDRGRCRRGLPEGCGDGSAAASVSEVNATRHRALYSSPISTATPKL